MALFTALHRALGRPPGELTDEMLDEAVALGAAETDDLDWKKPLPAAAGLPKAEFPKDVAAMANSGGGIIVFGVAEDEKAATGRVDTGVLTENHERALRKAAYTAITPPVFGLKFHRLGEDGHRAVVMVVPRTTDGPHLIYRDEMFGAPIRNDADTEWMKERQIDAMYRARHQEQQRSHEALGALYKATAARGETQEKAWIIGVARPRIPIVDQERIAQPDAATVFQGIEFAGLQYIHRAGQEWRRPSDQLEVGQRPRQGLRSWVAPPTEHAFGVPEEVWATLHDDGSVTLAAPIGAFRNGSYNELAAGNECRTETLETFTADFMALLKLASRLRATNDYELMVGVEWRGEEQLVFIQKNNHSHLNNGLSQGLPIARFSRLETTVRPDTDDNDYLSQVRDLATDLVNQAGFQHVLLLEDIQS